MAGGESAKVVGRYEVLEEIASGGMATVHLGRELGGPAPHRFVAVKRMHTQYARDADFRSMFLDEARLCAFIRHENVGRTLDVVDADGELLLILELIEGESLSRLAKQAAARGARIPIPMSSAIMVQTLRGLHAAHEAIGDGGEALHMVHRDVSPHNVLVGSDGVVKVVDFGVAKARGRMQQTAQGQVKGKLAYMSPEQARGKEVDRRSDVFAAGIVLWELLAGKRLFEGENEAHVLTQLLTERPARLGERDASLAPYEGIVERALSVDPGDRFASALEMAQAIEQAMPCASPTQLAAWVGDVAGPALAKRRDLLGKHLAIASRSDFDDTPRRELDEASTDDGPRAPAPAMTAAISESMVSAKSMSVSEEARLVSAPPRLGATPFPPTTAPGQLPASALRTQKLDPNDRPSVDLALPSFAQSRVGGALGPASDHRPSDAPPAQSQVTSVALTTNDLPPPLPEARVRQLTLIGAVSATMVALSLGSVLVIASKRPAPRGAHVLAARGLDATTRALRLGVPPPSPAPSSGENAAPTSAPSADGKGPSSAPAHDPSRSSGSGGMAFPSKTPPKSSLKTPARSPSSAPAAPLTKPSTKPTGGAKTTR